MGPPARLTIRADGGPGIGAGHLGRQLALAQAWRDASGAVQLVSSTPPEAWVRRYEAEGCAVVEPSAEADGAAWRSVDGYSLAAADRHGSGHTLVVDDGCEGGAANAAAADLLVDQNPGASLAQYGPDRTSTTALLGPRYALVRRELRLAAATPDGARGDARSVVVAMGGFPDAGMRRFIEAIRSDERLVGRPVVVLDGTADLAEVLPGAAVAFTTAGSMCWDLCLFGVPAVVTSVAPNQVEVARSLAAAGAVVDLGGWRHDGAGAAVGAVVALADDRTRLEAMAAAGRQLVDGNGAGRVVSRMRSELIDLRPVDDRDEDLLLAWSNDPVTRAASFSTESIAPAEHRSWLRRRLDDPSAVQLVGLDAAGRPLGLVRFDLDADNAEIGVTVAPDRRGHRWAAPLIDAGCRAVGARHGATRVVARVKPSNVASQRAFVDADFDLASGPGEAPLRYVRASS